MLIELTRAASILPRLGNTTVEIELREFGICTIQLLIGCKGTTFFVDMQDFVGICCGLILLGVESVAKSSNGISNVCAVFIIVSVFLKSAAKLLHQTVKSCQYVRKNALFLVESAFFRLRGRIMVDRYNIFHIDISLLWVGKA